MDAIEWKNDIPAGGPTGHIWTVDRAEAGGMVYEVRGHAGRWFVTRTAGDGSAQRTRFYPNQTTARTVYDELTNP